MTDLEMLKQLGEDLKEFGLTVNISASKLPKIYYAVVYQGALFQLELKGNYWQCSKLLKALFTINWG